MPDLTSMLSKFMTDLYTWASGTYAVGAFTGRAINQTAAVASVATLTVGGADSSYEVSANLLATVATAFSFAIVCAFTDESNQARSITMNMQLASGSISNGASLTNATGPIFMGIPMAIRCKAGTTITISTSGTFTTVTYNVEGFIKRTV